MNNEDSMRYNLVTKFMCAKCGHQLALSYRVPKVVKYEPEKSDGITGASKVEQDIAVHPCSKCYREAIEPLEALRKGLRAIGTEST